MYAGVVCQVLDTPYMPTQYTLYAHALCQPPYVLHRSIDTIHPLTSSTLYTIGVCQGLSTPPEHENNNRTPLDLSKR